MQPYSEELIKELVTVLKESKHFVLEQAPEVFQQIVKYEMVKSLMYLIIGLGFLVITCFSAKGIKTLVKNNEGKDYYQSTGEGLIIALTLTLTFSMIIGIILIADNLSGFVQVIYAPKVFIMEYLVRIGKSCK